MFSYSERSYMGNQKCLFEILRSVITCSKHDRFPNLDYADYYYKAINSGLEFNCPARALAAGECCSGWVGIAGSCTNLGRYAPPERLCPAATPVATEQVYQCLGALP